MANALRAHAKKVLPESVRTPVRMLEIYFKRLLVWPMILLQVRGEHLLDQLKLIASAFAAPVLSLRNLDRWDDPVLLFDTAVVVGGVGRFRLRRWCDDLWHVLPWREPTVLKFIRDTLKPGDVFVDAGANVGVYSVAAAKLVGNRGHVIAVEMMPDTAARLRKHLAFNAAEQVHVVERALSDDADQVLIARVPEGRFGQASIASARVNDAGLRSLSVTTTTLARLLDGIARVALMKMDIEGAELQALRGAGALIRRVEAVIFESWADSCGVAEYLLSMGYDVRRLDGRNWVAVRCPR